MHLKYKKKDINRIIVFMFITAIIFKPYYFDLSIIGDIINAIGVVLFAYYTYKIIKKKSGNEILYLTIAIRVIYLISAIKSAGDVVGVIRDSIFILLAIEFVIIESKRDLKCFITAVYGMMWIYSIINLLMLISSPQGINGHLRFYFWGFKNELGKYLMVYMLFSCLYVFMLRKNRFHIVMSFAVSLLTSILANTSTGIAGCLLFLISSVIGFALKDKNRINIYYIFTTVVFFIATILNSISTFSTFSYVIENILNRSASELSGRTIIWRNAIQAIVQSPFLGVGQLQYDRMWRTLGGNLNYSDCHSFYLNMAFYGGLVSIALFVLIMLKLIVKMNAKCNEIIGICNAAIFSFTIMFIFEGSSKPSFWLCIGIAYSLCDYAWNNRESLSLYRRRRKKI